MVRFIYFNSISIFYIIFFKPDNIALLLRVIKYGSGISIAIERECIDQKNCDNLIQGNLFIMTKEVAIVYQQQLKRVVEIPRKDIKSFSYLPSSVYVFPDCQFKKVVTWFKQKIP